MPRANRYFLPGYVWHITHRCHQRKFLLKFARDRRRYLHWLFEGKKRFGLCVLDYMVTSNHIHLLVKDTGPNVIAQSMQLIAGRTAQEYNQRKGKQGAFWEDRYHATAVEADEHLHRCLVYIDLNMVLEQEMDFPLRRMSPQGQSWIILASYGNDSAYLNAAFTRRMEFRIELYIDGGDKDENKNRFDQLFARREAIETAVGELLRWERLDNRRACRIAVYTKAQILTDVDSPILLGWAAKRASAFHKTFASELRSSETA
jgi:REP element-mobilizing transposase RayT